MLYQNLINNSLKRFLIKILPKSFVNLIHKFSPNSIKFYGPFPDWEEAKAKSDGYDKDNILQKVLEVTMKVKSGLIPGERDSVELEFEDPPKHIISICNEILGKNNNKLNILDVGGSLGSTYFASIKYLNEPSKISWVILEQKNFVSAGNKYISDSVISFITDIEEYLSETEPDLVIFGSVLQYLEDPYEILEKVTQNISPEIIIDRTPFSDDSIERVYVQSVPKKIYKASYPIRSLDLNSIIPKGYKINSKFIDGMGTIRLKKTSFTWKGYHLIK